MNQNGLPVVGFCAFSGTGKTSLLKLVIPRLRAQGLRVGVIKHADPLFDIDREGKDTYELRKAGAQQLLVASRRRMAWIEEFEAPFTEPVLQDVLPSLPANGLDLVLVEGFKRDDFPKIELNRAALGKPLMFPEDPNIIAVATDYPLSGTACNLPRMDINNAGEITEFIIEYTGLRGLRAEA